MPANPPAVEATKTHPIHEFAHDSPLIGCRFDPAGGHVFAGAQDFKVWRWRLADGTKTGLNTQSWARALAFVDGGRVLVTGGYDGRLMWWPAADTKLTPIRTVEAHAGWIHAVAASPDGSLIASVGNDQIVRLWNAATGKPVREMPGHDSAIYNVAFHPGGKRLATGDLMANVIDWEVSTGRMMRTWKAESLVKYDTTFLAFIGGFRGMTFNREGTRLAGSGITNVSNAFAGIGNPSAIVFDWETGKPVVEHLSRKNVRGVAWGVVLHPDGTTITAVGGNGGYLHFWKAGEKHEFHELKLGSDARDLDLCSDGLRLATAHFDGKVRVHRMTAKA